MTNYRVYDIETGELLAKHVPENELSGAVQRYVIENRKVRFEKVPDGNEMEVPG